MGISAAVTALLLIVPLHAATPHYSICTEAGYIPPPNPVALKQYISQPLAAAYDPHGVLYYANSFQVWRLNADGSDSPIAGTGIPSMQSAGDGGPAIAAVFLGIAGIAIDAQGNLFILDAPAYVIRKVTPDGKITTFAGTGKPSSGVSGARAGLPAISVAISPNALAVDAAGNVYVTDAVSNCIV